MEFGGILGLIILVADIWAVVKTIQSGASTGTKIIWVLVIFFLPLIGLIVWLIAGPRGARA